MPNFLMPRLNFSARSNGYWNGHEGSGALSESGRVDIYIFFYFTSALADLLIRLVFRLPEEADVLDEPRLDVLVVHELAEDVKLLAQELVGEIDLSCQRGKRLLFYCSLYSVASCS